MRGGSPEDWLAFGEGAEDLDLCLREVRAVAARHALTYYEGLRPVIQTARWILLALVALLAVTWMGGAVAVLLVAKPHDLAATLTAFSGVTSGGAVALGAIGLYLSRMENKALSALRQAMHAFS